MKKESRMSGTIETALELVIRCFAGVVDKDGDPYVMHCVRVMQGASSDEARIVGLLHDVIEDTDVTIDDLRNLGFSESVVVAVDSMTHRQDVSYADYVIGLKKNDIAREVKMSDLRDNSFIGRALLRAESRQRDLRRIQKYIYSYQYLSDRMSEEVYRSLMSELESGGN